MASKLWIYTNYDCNLSCSYCLAESGPRTPRRALGLAAFRRLIDEALPLGFDRFFLTGGEPFLLETIYDLLAYASARAETTVLTNGLLLSGKRLGRLAAIANPNLVVQVSLDGARAEHHDPYRGTGTWVKTVEAIARLQRSGLRVRAATTETPANCEHLAELKVFLRSLGIAGSDHISRPLARRGFATEGMEVGVKCLIPEITVTVDGVFWHPLASPGSTDMLVSARIFPLANAVAAAQQRLDEVLSAPDAQPRAVT